MSPRPGGKRASCDRRDAQSRLRQAEQFVTLAQAADDDPLLRSAATTNFVLAGIAAADAICCVELQVRSADGDHGSAIRLLESVDQGMADRLRSLLRLKRTASYDVKEPNAAQLRGAHRSAVALVSAAQQRLTDEDA